MIVILQIDSLRPRLLQEAMEQELISELGRWKETTRILREKLVAEREVVTRRLEEIERGLAMIPAEEGIATQTRGAGISRRDSLADVIRKILQSAAEPLTAGEVVVRVMEARPSIKKKSHVHSALFRLKERHEVDPIGEPGSLRYQWSKANG